MFNVGDKIIVAPAPTVAERWPDEAKKYIGTIQIISERIGSRRYKLKDLPYVFNETVLKAPEFKPGDTVIHNRTKQTGIVIQTYGNTSCLVRQDINGKHIVYDNKVIQLFKDDEINMTENDVLKCFQPMVIEHE